MATTLSFIPLVGLDKIVAIRNVNDDDILAQRAVPLYPDIPQDAEGRPGKMRVAFRLFQADGTTPDDLALIALVKCPIPFTLPEDSQNFPKWAPICSITQLGTPTSDPQIGNGAPAMASYGTLPSVPNSILINMAFVSAADFHHYDVCIDWSHSVAS